MYRIIGADGKEYGPISADQLRQWIAEGRANAATRVAIEGANEWTVLGALPEFAPLLTGAGRPQAVPGQSPRTNGFAMAGFILGLASFFTLPISVLCCCFGPVFNLLGVLFSVIGLSQINRSPQLYTGKGFAMAGLILSVISVLLFLGLLALGVISSNLHPDFSNHVHRL